jgi:pimeloyl-ACP methyl ester carboxylesterase
MSMTTEARNRKATRRRSQRPRKARGPQLSRADGPTAANENGPEIWREALWGLDWLSLRLSPVYLGIGVPRGDGSPVVLVPGFLTTDAYLVEMYFWLRRVGYDPHLSGIGVNADCIEALTRRLEKTVEDVHGKTGRRVRIVGHSLGGFLGRRLALRRPDMVSQLIQLGSPIQALEAHPAIMSAARVVAARSAHRTETLDRVEPRLAETEVCGCEANHCVPSPPSSVQRAALYSREDGVIDWRNCLEGDTSLNHEVGGTHIGMVFNAKVYKLIAELLAEGSVGATVLKTPPAGATSGSRAA